MIRPLAFCLTTSFLVLASSLSAQPPDLTKVTSRAQLDAAIATTSNAALKQALQTHASAILAAAAQRAHAEAVVETIKVGLGEDRADQHHAREPEANRRRRIVRLRFAALGGPGHPQRRAA